MSDLDRIFAGLVRHHIATPAQPVPPTMGGVTWIFANNGLFKRGTDQHLDVLIQTRAWTPDDVPPGLTNLLPIVRWLMRRGRIPGAILAPILQHAQRVGQDQQGILHPIEQQYFVTWQAGRVRVTLPPQNASADRVRYTVPDSLICLVDLHSHHGMKAYFSQTDDRDDAGLSVSVVIGRLFTRPELRVRLNCFGHRQEVPALSVFDQLGSFMEAGESYADVDA